MDRIRKTMLMALIAVAACQTQEPEQTGTSEEEVAGMSEAAEMQIEERSRAFESALVAADPVALTAIYTEDAVLLPPDMTRSSGAAEIRTAFEGMFQGSTITSATLTTDEIHVAESGDIAYRVGTFQIGGTTPDGVAFTDTGKLLETWHNVDGTWLIAADMWNSDAPMTGEQVEGETAEPVVDPAPKAQTDPEAQTAP